MTTKDLDESVKDGLIGDQEDDDDLDDDDDDMDEDDGED